MAKLIPTHMILASPTSGKSTLAKVFPKIFLDIDLFIKSYNMRNMGKRVVLQHINDDKEFLSHLISFIRSTNLILLSPVKVNKLTLICEFRRPSHNVILLDRVRKTPKRVTFSILKRFDQLNGHNKSRIVLSNNQYISDFINVKRMVAF